MGNIKAATLIILFFITGVGVGSQRERLLKIKKELAEKRKELTELSKKEKGVVNELARLDKEISVREAIISRYFEEERILKSELESLNLALEKTSKALEMKKKIISNLMIYEYQKGKIGFIEFIFSDERLSTMLERIRFINLLSLAHKEQFLSFKQNKDELLNLIAEKNQKIEELKTLLQEKENELTSLRQSKAERAARLDEIRARKNEYQEAVERLERSQKELAHLIEKETSGVTFEQTGYSISALKGKLIWPVKGKRNIIRHYGHIIDKRYNTRFYNPGIDIKAFPLEPVYAVHHGEVVFTGWLQGYENIVIIKHPGNFYTVYGNLGNVDVQKGLRVKAGTKLGDVSSTGWLDGPKVHFEIRMGKKEVNPVDWLAKR